MTTLLEKAKKDQIDPRGVRHKVTQQDVEVAIAWARGELKLCSVGAAYGYTRNLTNNSVYLRLAKALRLAVQTGKLK